MPTPSASELLTGVDPGAGGPGAGGRDDSDPAAVGRFRTDLIALSEPPTPARPLALAVSGGPDSMAMLALAAGAFPGAVVAASVDHGLRPAAADEAALVAGHCAAIGVPHATLRPPAPIAGASIQAQARAARYALLSTWAGQANAIALATAHHADDQAETFLMRAARGSGVGGLAGIRARRELRIGADDSLPLIRPLLGWRREELRALAVRAGVPFVDDPSNVDRAHDRSRFRQLIAGSPDLDVAALAASARHAAEAEATLAELEALEWRKRRCWDAADVEIDVTDLPRGLRRRLVRLAIGTVRADHAIARPAWTDTDDVESLLRSLEAGAASTRAGVMSDVRGTHWRFRPAPPRRPPKEIG